MTSLNLHASDPVFASLRAKPSELIEAIRELDQWDSQTISMANMLLTVWASKAIASPNDPEGIAELQRLIHYALKTAISAPSIPDEFRHRWNQTNDMLEARHLELTITEPTTLLQRRHIPEILEFLLQRSPQEVRQAEIETLIKVSPGRVTQLVGSLCACRLTSKRKKGRDIMLQLTAEGRKQAEHLAPERSVVLNQKLKPKHRLSMIFSTEPEWQNHVLDRLSPEYSLHNTTSMASRLN